MDKAQLILYGVATYLAIKSLVTLMSDHRQTYKKKLAEELKATPPAASVAALPTPPKIALPASQRTAAAAIQAAAPAKNAAKDTAKNTLTNSATNPAKTTGNETVKAEAAAKKAG